MNELILKQVKPGNSYQSVTFLALAVVTPATPAPSGFFESLSAAFRDLGRPTQTFVLLLILVAFIKAIELLVTHVRALRAGYRRAENRAHWIRETMFGLLMMAFNPFKAITWLAIFLTRNCIGLTPYFAWTFFISLVAYIGIGMTILAKTPSGSWIRPTFYILGPAWLLALTLIYDWGYMPLVVLVPAALSSTPASFRLACLLLVPRPFPLVSVAGDDDDSPFGKPVGPKPGRPVIRGPLTFRSELGALGVTWATAHWAVNGLMTSDPKPGTFSYVMKHKVKGFSTAYGAKVETYVDDYVVKHGLESDIDGRRRGTADFFRQTKPTSAQMFQLAKQSAIRSVPFVVSGVLAFGVTKALFEVEKPTQLMLFLGRPPPL